MSNEEVQRDRREVMRQDADWRAQARRAGATSYHEMAQTSVGFELGGRFAHLAKSQTIVAADPKVAVPRMPSNSFWAQPFPSEEPLSDQSECGDVLGYSIDGTCAAGSDLAIDPPRSDPAVDQHNGAGSLTSSEHPVELSHDKAPDAQAHARVSSSSGVGSSHPKQQPTFKRRI
jgi:hypothetical protein